MKLPATFSKQDHLHTIIETPRGSRNKFVYDEELQLFRLKKVLPGGTVFPVDMGFVPGTNAEDGDPLDVFIFMEGYSYPGCLIECRAVGIIKAEQGRIGQKQYTNDRIIAVPVVSSDHAGITDIIDINTDKLNDLLNFCRYYNEMEGKKFSVIDIKGHQEAMRVIKEKSERQLVGSGH